MRNQSMSVHSTSASGENQEPAKTSCKARVEARSLKPGDVIVRRSGNVERRDNVQEVRCGWWCRAYVFANGGSDVLTFRETELLEVLRGPVYHIDSVNTETGMRARMTSYPMSEQQCRTMMGKITAYPTRRLELVEVQA